MQESDHSSRSEPMSGPDPILAAIPPHPLNKRWFVHVDDTTFGPYSGHKIKQMVKERQLFEADLLCPEGGMEWTQAKNVPLLGTFFADFAPPARIASKLNGNETSYTIGIVAIGLGFGACFMPYFAAVFFLPGAIVCGLIALRRGQKRLGSISLILSVLGFIGVISVSNDLTNIQTDLQKSLKEFEDSTRSLSRFK